MKVFYIIPLLGGAVTSGLGIGLAIRKIQIQLLVNSWPHNVCGTHTLVTVYNKYLSYRRETPRRTSYFDS